MSVHFQYFLFKWKGVKPTSMSDKRERERGEKTNSTLKNISKTPEKFSLVTVITNYHKLSLLPLVFRP